MCILCSSRDGAHRVALDERGGHQLDGLEGLAVHHPVEGLHGQTAHADLIHPHGGDGRTGIFGDHQVVQADEGDVLGGPKAQLGHVADGVGGVGVAGAEDGRGPGGAGEHLLHGVGGGLGDVVDDPLEPLRAAGHATVPEGVVETGVGLAVELGVAVGDQKADVPMALLGQIAHGPVGRVIVVHLQQGHRAVPRHVAVHAEEGKLLRLEQLHHLFVEDLDEDDAVGLLAVDGVHQLAAFGLVLHRSKDHAVAQGFALPEDAGEHVHGKEVEEAEVILPQHHMDREAPLEIEPPGVNVGGKARLVDDGLDPLPGGLGDAGAAVEHEGYRCGGYARHPGNVANG